MQAVILLAGFGSRLSSDDLPHKSLLPFGNQTLLSRHLFTLQKAGIKQTTLVLGHNEEKVKDYCLKLKLDMPLRFISNKVYKTTGNTLSMVMGLEGLNDDVLILDGDILYPEDELLQFLKETQPSAFAVVPGDPDDIESAKTLVKPDDTIGALVSKRPISDEENKKFRFLGEAIGFFTLSRQAAQASIDLYKNRDPQFIKSLWEDFFSVLVETETLNTFTFDEQHCFEIDTQEDYQHALNFYNTHPQLYPR